MDIEQELRLRHIDQQHDATWRCLDHALVQRNRITQAHGLLPVLGALLAGQKAGMQASLAVAVAALLFCFFVSQFTLGSTLDLRLLQIHLDQSGIASRRALAPGLHYGFESEQRSTFSMPSSLGSGSDPMKSVVKSSFGLCLLDALLLGGAIVLLVACSRSDQPNRWASPGGGAIFVAVAVGGLFALLVGWHGRRSLERKDRDGERSINDLYYRQPE